MSASVLGADAAGQAPGLMRRTRVFGTSSENRSLRVLTYLNHMSIDLAGDTRAVIQRRMA